MPDIGHTQLKRAVSYAADRYLDRRSCRAEFRGIRQLSQHLRERPPTGVNSSSSTSNTTGSAR
jgi:hypothetical protein